MKKLLFGFIVGVLVGAWGYAAVQKAPSRRTAAEQATTVSRRTPDAFFGTFEWKMSARN
jgi:gas vesicle protein